MYIVELSQRAQKFVDKLDLHLRERIENNLKRLKENPIPSDSKFIGRDGEYMIFSNREHSARTLTLL